MTYITDFVLSGIELGYIDKRNTHPKKVWCHHLSSRLYL